MKISKIVYVNLDSQPERRTWIETMLDVVKAPKDRLQRFAGIDGMKYASRTDIASAAVQDGFTEFQKDLPDWFGTGDLAVGWTWRRLLRDIPQNETWFVLLDDEQLRHPFSVFESILKKAPAFDLFQFMHWDNGMKQDVVKLTLCEFDQRFLVGEHTYYPGDNACAISGIGAQKLLRYFAKDAHVFLESLVTDYKNRGLDKLTIISPGSEDLKFWTETVYKESYRVKVNEEKVEK